MIVATAVPSLGFDADTVVSAAVAKQFFSLGYRWCARYVSRSAPEAGDLTPEEISTILAAGLALIVVQHAPEPNWTPNDAEGLAWGRAAVANVEALGIPPGLSIAKDHEGVNVSGRASTVAAVSAAHINLWSAVVRTAKYEPLLYVGFDCGLDATQLYDNLTPTRYWKSASNVPTPVKRGYCMEQLNINQTRMVDGQPFSYDEDVIMADALGGLPKWAVGG
jgi:hypothetical protein